MGCLGLESNDSSPDMGMGQALADHDVSLKAYFDFIQAFARSCFDSEPYGWAGFHMLIGSMPNIRKLRIRRGDSYLDPRVHVCYLSPSGSGKGEGAGFITEVGQQLGLRLYNATDFTDAALIGTIRTTDNGEPVVHKGLLSGETMEWNEAQQVEEHQDIDILYVSEASKILDPRPGPNDKLIMNSLQIAMNTAGTSDNQVTKKLAEGPSVSYGTDVTLFMTTYPPVTFADVILKRGLFQRTLLVVKEPQHQERVRVTKEFFRSFYSEREDVYHNPLTKTISFKSTEEIVSMVTLVIKKANRWAKGKQVIEVSEPAAKRLENLVLGFQEQVKGLSPFLQSKIHEFIARLSGHLVKLASHVAILNHSETIEEEHVKALEKLHAPSRFEDLITYLSNNVEEPKEFTVRLEREIRNLSDVQISLASKHQYQSWQPGKLGWREKADFERRLAKRMRLPPAGAKEMLNRHMVWGNVQRKRASNRTFVRLDPDVEVRKNGQE